MGYVKDNLRLRSPAAGKALERATSLFPGGRWLDSKKEGVPETIARWEKAMDTLVAETKEKNYDKVTVETLRKDIKRVLGMWESNPGETEKLLAAAQNNMDNLLKELPD